MEHIYYLFDRLIVNFFLIVIPLFLYFTFWHGRTNGISKWTKLIYSVVLFISMYLCINYPIHLTNTFTFDLSNIPFILGILYGGFLTGLFLLITTCLYLFFNQAGQVLFVDTVLMCLLIIIITLIKGHYKSEKNKPLLISSILFITALIAIYTTNFINHTALLNLSTSSLTFIIIQSISMWIITFFTEKLMMDFRTEQSRMMLTEKLKIVSELSASISHEIRNPLTVTKGFLQLLLHKEDISINERNYIDLSLQELIRAEKIINNYLTLAKPDDTHLNITNLKEDIDYVRSVIEPYAAMNQVEVIANMTNTIQINCEQSKIRQALINIMKNSIEAMTHGGKLELNLSTLHNHVIIEIIDNGIGMTKEQIRRLGMPYFSTKSNGTGLGLSVVYSIFSQLHATIHIESHIGVGTHFTISIPNQNKVSLKPQKDAITSTKSLA